MDDLEGQGDVAGEDDACADAAHRVHARVEDAIRTGKDTGIGRFPSHEFEMNDSVQDVPSPALDQSR